MTLRTTAEPVFSWLDRIALAKKTPKGDTIATPSELLQSKALNIK